jgi:hypothetical protein
MCWRSRKVRATLWPLFAWSAWAQPATLVADTTVEGAALVLYALSAWAQPATVVAGKTGEGAALASFRLVGMGSASHCGGTVCTGSHCVGGHDS